MRLSLASKQAAFGVAIILPTLAILAIFRFLPMVQAFYLSLTQYDLVHPPKVVGLANFVDLLQDPLFLKSARVSLTYVLFSVVPVLPLSLGLAVLFNRSLFAQERASFRDLHARRDARRRDGRRLDFHVPAGRRYQHDPRMVRHRSRPMAAQQRDLACGR